MSSERDITDEYPDDIMYQAAKLALFRAIFGDDVTAVDIGVTGGCGSNTCEYTAVAIMITMGDGTRRRGETAFGLYLQDVILSCDDYDRSTIAGIRWEEVGPDAV